MRGEDSNCEGTGEDSDREGRGEKREHGTWLRRPAAWLIAVIVFSELTDYALRVVGV
jgi:hypothetical protein